MKPFYSIRVDPGNQTVRKRADQMITATLAGFLRAQGALLRQVRQRLEVGAGRDARPQPGGSAYQFLIAGVPESLEYYVEAGGVRSPHYKLNVVDLPAVKKIRVTYHFPSWTGMKDEVEDPGGDLRAVEGTEAEVAVQTDRPLASGASCWTTARRLPLRAGRQRQRGGQRAHPKGRHVSRRRGRRRRRRAPERRLLHRGAEGPAAGSQDHPAGPRFPRLAPSRKSPWRWTPRTISG